MTVKEVKEKKNVLVGIRLDSYSRALLNWALVKIAEPGDRVFAIHVCGDSDNILVEKSKLDGYTEVYDGLCKVKKVDLTGQVLIGRSIKKTLVTEAKNCSAVAVIVGTNKPIALRGWHSVARYCAKHLPSSTEVIALHKGEVVFRRTSSNLLSGENTLKERKSEFDDSEEENEILSPMFKSCKCRSRYNNGDSGKISSLINRNRKSDSELLSNLQGKPWEQKPGWPLLRKAETTTKPQAYHVRKLSVVQWVMSLPDRSPPETPPSSKSSASLESHDNRSTYTSSSDVQSSSTGLPQELQLLLKANSSGCKWLSHEVLEIATSGFSPENLIGKGGCTSVYKGHLPNGKLVAVKILRSSKEAWKDFALEIDIVSSLKYMHITPLLGVCIEDNKLISVYDFMSGGSLEENLHGNKKKKIVLSWKLRFNTAVRIAEALNYLHNEAPQPVIHRDVKSSNILLSSTLEPQLSDFGLAIWGPTASDFLNEDQLVGTFGYLAPEYFMSGKVSDKIDVYAFGVVLLELLSGRKPICSDSPKGMESLVMWAKPRIERGDLRGLLDPTLEGNFDEAQMERMVIAATLCLTMSARLRPGMSQILKLLNGEECIERWLSSWVESQEDFGNQNNIAADAYPESCTESHTILASVDLDDEPTSSINMEESNGLSCRVFGEKMETMIEV